MNSQSTVFRLLQEDCLNQIASVAGQFNIFEAVGMANQEIKHSSFLAFLLNPNETHGLGAAFLQGFLSCIFDSDSDECPNYGSWNLAGLEVEREWNFIDLLIRIPKERVVVVIENKIWTDEHSNQLSRYYNVA